TGAVDRPGRIRSGVPVQGPARIRVGGSLAERAPDAVRVQGLADRLHLLEELRVAACEVECCGQCAAIDGRRVVVENAVLAQVFRRDTALLRLIRGLEGQGGGVLQRLQVTGVEPALQPCTVDSCWRSQRADALHTPLLTLRIAELQYGGRGPCLGIPRHPLHNALQGAHDAVHTA